MALEKLKCLLIGLPNTGQTAPWHRLDLWFDNNTSVEGLFNYTISGDTLNLTVLYTGLGISPTDQIGFRLVFGMMLLVIGMVGVMQVRHLQPHTKQNMAILLFNLKTLIVMSDYFRMIH